MLTNRQKCIVIQFLALSHIAHCYVLLTADVEDIKRIAKKLLPAQIVDSAIKMLNKITKDGLLNRDDMSAENEISDNNKEFISNERELVRPPKKKRSKKRKPKNIARQGLVREEGLRQVKIKGSEMADGEAALEPRNYYKSESATKHKKNRREKTTTVADQTDHTDSESDEVKEVTKADDAVETPEENKETEKSEEKAISFESRRDDEMTTDSPSNPVDVRAASPFPVDTDELTTARMRYEFDQYSSILRRSKSG